eukprot:8402098-Alexandrium_andersonii.AAC.1
MSSIRLAEFGRRSCLQSHRYRATPGSSLLCLAGAWLVLGRCFADPRLSFDSPCLTATGASMGFRRRWL